MDELDWDRLGDYVRAARGARSQKAIHAAGGPTDTTLGKIETKQWRPRRGVDETLQKLDAGLGWVPGSAAAILRGGDPTPAGGTTKLGRILSAMSKSPDQWTPEEREVMAEHQAARRPDPALGVGPDGEFLSAEAMFAEWQQARNRMLNAVLGYARARAIPFAKAQSELDAVQQMTNDVTYGRPWTPPWDPGAEFDEEDEPWRAHWWWEPDGVAAAERLGLEPSKWMLGPTVGRDVTSIEDLRRPSSSQANEDQDADPAIGSGGLFRGAQRAAESNLGHARDPVETENRDSSTEIGQSSPAKGREGDEVSEGASGDPISRLAQSGPDIHQRKTAKRGERQHR